MKRFKIVNIVLPLILFVLLGFTACSTDSEDGGEVIIEEEGEVEEEASITELSTAFSEFSDAVTVILSSDGTQIDIETTGFPNHRSIYWETDNALYEDEPDVRKTTENTFIGGGRGEASSFTVDAVPDLTGATVATELGTIGIAVSGSAIFNDQEGAGDLDEASGSLDWAGAHKGPGVYHYHLEPTPITSDDDSLVGILMDGVFLYGRKDYPSNEYPTDLDASGGHFGPTPHNADGEYHYHIINEVYPTGGNYAYEPAYVLFAGPFQGY